MRLLIVLAALAFSLGGAGAATPPHADLSKLRCEMPEVTAVIRKGVRTMRLTDGTPLLNYMGNNSNLKATTISTARDKLVCRVTINFTINGASTDVRGLYIVRLFPGGKLNSEFVPGY